MHFISILGIFQRISVYDTKDSHKDILEGLRDGVKVAVKQFPLDQLKSVDLQVHRYNNLRHRNLMQFYDCERFFDKNRNSEYYHIATRFYETNMESYKKENKQNLKDIEFFKQLLEALAYLHENGIVHGNITAEKFFISSEGLAILSDFGCEDRDTICVRIELILF